MADLEVTILAGPTAGQRLVLHGGIAAFGRDAGGAIVIDRPEVSRHHGELHKEGDTWVVVNHSPNGTLINGKKVGRRSKAIVGPSTLSVGRMELMKVVPKVQRHGVSRPVDGRAIEEAGREASSLGSLNRTKLLLGVIGFWVVLFAVLIGIKPFINGSGRGGEDSPVARWTDAQITAAVREKLPPQPADERAYEQALAEAENLYAQRSVRENAAGQALWAYKQALSYRTEGSFDEPILQRRYLDLSDQVSQMLTERYRDAYGKYASDRYGQALSAFDTMIDLYPDYERGPASFQRHLQTMRDATRRQAGG